MKRIYARVPACNIMQLRDCIKAGFAPWLIDYKGAENPDIKLKEGKVDSFKDFIKFPKKYPEIFLYLEYLKLVGKYGVEKSSVYIYELPVKKYPVIALYNLVWEINNGLVTQDQIDSVYASLEKKLKYNEPEIIYAVARMYLKGIHYRKNEKKAVSLLKKISKVHPGAQRLLAVCYSEGFGVKPNKRISNKYFSLVKNNDYVSFFDEHPELINITQKEIKLEPKWAKAKDLLEKCSKLKPCKYINIRSVNEYLDYLKRRDSDEGRNLVVIKNIYNIRKVIAEAKLRKDESDDILFTYAVHLSQGLNENDNRTEFYKVVNELIKKDCKRAYNLIGLAYYFGYGVEKDMDKYFEYMEKAELNNEYSSYFQLTQLYANKNTKFYNPEKAFEYAEKMLEVKDYRASDRIAMYYARGIGVEQNPYVADKFVKLADKLNNGLLGTVMADACLFNSEVYHRKEDIINAYTKLATKYQNPIGYEKLGIFYKKEKNYKKAMECFVNAVAYGRYEANSQIALLYEFGLGVKQNIEKAVEYYVKGDNGSTSYVYNNMGVKYLHGTGGLEKDTNKGIELIKKAIQLNDGMAYVNLADCYLDGLGVEQDIEKGLSLLKEGMEKNLAEPYTKYGEILYRGYYGVKQDLEGGLELINKSISLKSQNGKITLAWYYFYTKNYDLFSKMIFEMDKSIENDMRYDKAVCYFKGYGVKKDVKKAIHILEQYLSQRTQSGEGYLVLGRCYQELKEENKAFECFVKGVEYKSIGAIGDLAYCYTNGLGVQKDEQKAKELIVQGAALGNTYCKKRLELLEKGQK